MNIKLISLVSGAVLVPSVAIPTSLSLKKDSSITELESIQEETPKVQESEQSTTAKQPAKAKTVKPKGSTAEEKSLEPFTKNRKEGASEDYYLRPYRNYFLKPYEGREQWESKFNSNRGRSSEIDIPSDYEDDEDYVTITRAFDSERPSTLSKNNLALNVFCSEAYFESGEQKSGSWDFTTTNNSVYVDLEEEGLWKLCSAFPEKPNNIWDAYRDNIAYKGNQIGSLYNPHLMALDGNDSFWEKRQEEWESLASVDDDYFQKREDKKIKDLCKDAYEKESGAFGVPTLDTVKKYCGLEWNF